jgi:DNA-binding transcriptional MerR regulator
MSQLNNKLKRQKRSKTIPFLSVPSEVVPNLPELPDQIYFSIGDVASVFNLEPYRLRYWEREFAQLVPIKRSNSRRYYSRDDMYLVGLIKHYVIDEGYTIQAASARIDALMNRLSSEESDQDGFNHADRSMSLPSQSDSAHDVVSDEQTEHLVAFQRHRERTNKLIDALEELLQSA